MVTDLDFLALPGFQNKILFLIKLEKNLAIEIPKLKFPFFLIFPWEKHC